MAIHEVSKRDWPKLTWKFPRIHNFEFGFGLTAESAVKNSTIVPYVYQNNAIVDYETIKTNPENVDFAVVAYGDTCAGSYIPKIQVGYQMFIPPIEVTIVHLRVNTMPIHTSMLNRLDAFDKKTNKDIESIIEMQHATDDEIAYPLFNGNILFEGQGVHDIAPLGGYADIGLTDDGQPEGVTFDQEEFFDAMHYFTNKQMLKTVTGGMRSHIVSEPLIPHGRSIVSVNKTMETPSLCKFQHPYTFCGELFTVPAIGTRTQYHFASETTGIEHLSVRGYVRFNEYNPDFNFARA